MIFDNGTLSSYSATIELVEAGASCTHFIIPDRVNRQDRNLMSWSQIRELAAAGVEMGSHSLIPHLPNLSDRELAGELKVSSQILEDNLGRAITSFAYPYGKYDKRVIKATADNGYECAFTTRHLYARNASDVYQIPRFEPLESMDSLAQLVQGQGHWFYRLLSYYYQIRDVSKF